MKKTNFDRYVEEQMRDPAFAARFEQAGEAWEVALQLAALRQRAGLSQGELAKRLKTSQQHISRLESSVTKGTPWPTFARSQVLCTRASAWFLNRTSRIAPCLTPPARVNRNQRLVVDLEH